MNDPTALDAAPESEWQRMTMMAMSPEMWASSLESFVTQVTMCLVRLGLPQDEARIFLAEHLGTKPVIGGARPVPISRELAQKIVAAAEELLKRHGKTPGAQPGSQEYARDVEALFQRLWTKAVGTEGYNKVEWTRMSGYLHDLIKRAGTPADWD